MFLDVIPGSSGKKRVSRSLVQKIKDGGIIADEIRRASDRQHSENDIPQAERHLNDSLEKWPEQEIVISNEEQKNTVKNDIQKTERNFLQKILHLIKAFLWTEL
jgi:transcriptional regulator of heat shock response